VVEYPWWEPYKFAVLETNRNKLRDRVNAAEQAIRERASLNGQVSSEERIAIQDAMSALKNGDERASTTSPVSFRASLQTLQDKSLHSIGYGNCLRVCVR